MQLLVATSPYDVVRKEHHSQNLLGGKMETLLGKVVNISKLKMAIYSFHESIEMTEDHTLVKPIMKWVSPYYSARFENEGLKKTREIEFGNNFTNFFPLQF